MLLFSISFLIGVSQLLWLPKINIDWLLIVLPLFVILLFIRNKYKSISFIFIGMLLGFSYGITQAHFAKTKQLKSIPTNSLEITGTITSLPVITEMGNRGNRTKFALTIDPEIALEIPVNKLLVSWYNSEKPIEIGQKWAFNLKMKPIHGYKNPGSFDYSKWLFRQGFDATATVKSSRLINNNESFNIKYWINQQRAEISFLIDKKFNSQRVKGLIQALSIGDKSKITYEDSQLFQETGTSHLIAISGLHIGLIAFIGILFGRLLFFISANEKINRFKYEAVFAISFALFYAMLAGLSIPTLRALVMVVVFSLAYASKNNVSRWTAWAFAMLVVLIYDPFSVLDVGFWFSFSAVAVLMFTFAGRNNKDCKLCVFIKAQIVILIGLMPLMAIIFQKINLLTPVANLLVLPLASFFLIPLMFASFIINLFSEKMSNFLFNIVEMIANTLFKILDYLQNFNFLTFPIQKINFSILLALFLLMIILLLPKLFRWKVVALFLLLPLFLDHKNNINNTEFKVNVLDVGQGLSVIIQTKSHVLVYDTGAKYESGFSFATSVVMPYLQNQGIKHIDTLIISHDDNDHAGGANELKAFYRNMEIIDVKGHYSNCQMPKTWHWDEVTFTVLSPFEVDPYLGNNSSCVIKVSSSNGSILLTGDIEEPVEYRLIKNLAEEIVSDLMIVPHHGSKTSSSMGFIDRVNPKIVLNSSGYANQFNHPHPTIKQRYLDKNIEFLDTQNKGMIEAFFSDQKFDIIQYQDDSPHFWHVN